MYGMSPDKTLLFFGFVVFMISLLICGIVVARRDLRRQRQTRQRAKQNEVSAKYERRPVAPASDEIPGQPTQFRGKHLRDKHDEARRQAARRD